MHDIDAHIKRISGQQNYMEQVAVITGNIEHVDMEMWEFKHRQICASENNIKKLLQSIVEEGTQLKIVTDEFEILSNNMNLKNRLYKNKKDVLKIANGYRPINLAKSEWFKCIRNIEKNINDYISDVIGNNTKTDSEIRANVISKEAENIERAANVNTIAIKAIYAKSPEIRGLKFILGVNVKDSNCKAFMLIHQYARLIINTLLYPMYNVRARIDKSEKQLMQVIKHDIAKKQNMSMEMVKKALESFVVAKFRTSITDSAEHYLKLFFSIVGDEDTSNMDGARFLEMMDSLNVESLGNEHKAYMFATRAKEMIKKVSTGEKLDTKEILNGFKDLFSEKEPDIKTTKDFSNDLL